jgi:hypothetical protein
MGFDDILKHKASIDAAEAQFVKSCTPERAIEAWQILNMILRELGNSVSKEDKASLLEMRDETKWILRKNSIHGESAQPRAAGIAINWEQVVSRMRSAGGDFIDSSKGVPKKSIETLVLGEGNSFKASQWNDAGTRNSHLNNNGKSKAAVRYFVKA